MKLPKIDLKKYKKKNLQKIFSTDISVKHIKDTSVDRDGITCKHSISIDGTPYMTGKSQLVIFNDVERIYWMQFFPFNHITMYKEALSPNMSEENLRYNIEIYDKIKEDNPEIINGYRIISKTIERRLDPVALIRNYVGLGIGALAQYQILENIIERIGAPVEKYGMRHGSISPFRENQLEKIGIIEFTKDGIFNRNLGIVVEETVMDYFIKTEQYARKRGLL